MDAKRYRVVTNAYSANGNDGWQALARAQRQSPESQSPENKSAERVDLAWVAGQLTAFPVLAVAQRGEQLSAVYGPGKALDCKAANVDCGTDAASFVDYVRYARPLLTALDEETVTLLRSK
ncbi:hypothetical protein D3C80_1443360 [compost metagenome]